ncbi:UPF0496 protein At1g20180 [Linum grandiflorum]
MTKLSWTKLQSFLFHRERSQKEGSSAAGSLSNKLTVNEEYKEAFRTESYVEMWTELQSKLMERRRISSNSSTTSSSSSSGSSLSSSSSSMPSHLSDYLFRPPPEQETFSKLVERFGGDGLLIEYFESSLVACDICEMLLRSVDSTRAHYNKLKRVIKLAKRVKLCDELSHNFTSKVSAAMYRDLAGYAMHANPLSIVEPVRFEQIHSRNSALLRELTRKTRSIKRRAKLNRILKKVGGCTVVILHTTLMVTLLAMALHSLAGILVVPAVISCMGGFLRRKKPHVYAATTSTESRLCAQLDIAAKGMFFLVNDFDSISRLVTSLSNEVEHRKVLAGMCVRNKNGELLKQVVRELIAYDDCYSEQLEELEQHVYLCFHTINRSRRFLLQELMKEVDNKGFDHDDASNAETKLKEKSKVDHNL